VVLPDKVFAELESKSSTAVSLGRIEHSNLPGCLQNSTLSFKKQLSANLNLHDQPEQNVGIATILSLCIPD
jgi:hypothetical protein